MLGEKDLGGRVIESIHAFLSKPAFNNMGPGTTVPAWDGVLVGFSSGADRLYTFFKEHIGPFHWTPAEAFALGLPPAEPLETGTSTRAGIPVPVPPEDLTVISWALCQTEHTRISNRAETRLPSEPWARARIFGQAGNVALHRALLDSLEGWGYRAVAPNLLPQAGDRLSATYGKASTWSERHAAFVSGLGTFGLAGGLITERGQAVRFGSVIVKAQIPATSRPYGDDAFAYCLFHREGTCGICIDRCPTGSVSKEGRDKEACSRHLDDVTAPYVDRQFGFAGYGCGLCQTGVPCETGIPTGRADRT